jgi:hypothetical protein
MKILGIKMSQGIGMGCVWLLATSCFVANEAKTKEGHNPDPSFEIEKSRDQFGRVFEKWEGWKFEGDCEFRVSRIAHTGQKSCLLFAGGPAKIRIFRTLKHVQPGRYRITAYLRGLDIGTAQWGQTTEFAFNEKYIQLNKNGTFGWTKLTYVTDITQKKDTTPGPSVGLMAPGFLWVDDVRIVKVSKNVPLTKKPVLGPEEAPIKTTFTKGQKFRNCPVCGYKVRLGSHHCQVCGESQHKDQVRKGPATKILTSFEDKKTISQFQNLGVFGDAAISSQHASHGSKSLKIEKQYTSWDAPLDFSGYDFLLVDLYTEAVAPQDLFIEIWDQETKGYWTRVNYQTVVPPGRSVLNLPIEQLYVGEKSRPGRKLLSRRIKRLVFSIGDKPKAPLFIDNIRLQRDTQTAKKKFPRLYAFDFGTSKSPLMPGFVRINPSVIYNPGRGYGLKDAKIWRSFDVLQPDPLYQDFLCIEKGGLALDLPNGNYRVFVNMDNPSGYWGEYQTYQNRTILAEGKPVIQDKMSFDSFVKKYFRFWDTEDLPDDNTFDKYQRAYYREKQFDVTVQDGQLNIDFQGQNWACSISTIIVFPLADKKNGQAFLDYVQKRRRFYFDNYFKRVLPKKPATPPSGTPLENKRGYMVFCRDYMRDVNWDSQRQPTDKNLIQGFGFKGDIEPMTLSIVPLLDLGQVRFTISPLKGPKSIETHNVELGYVSYRISRITMDGSVYTIKPRLIVPASKVEIKKGITRRLWLTIHIPQDAAPGLYRGFVNIIPEKGETSQVPVEFKVFNGQLLEADVPVGPWGHQITLPWFPESTQKDEFNNRMARLSLYKLRESGFTSLSGLPIIHYQGFQNGKPVLDFSQADKQMELVRQAGFHMPIINYTLFEGLNLYFQDDYAMKSAGYQDYQKFIKTIFSSIQQHAKENNWLDVYWNLGDEPLGEDLTRAIQNAHHYRQAFPKGPPYFTAATSFTSADRSDKHFELAKNLHVVNLNGHNEKSVQLLREQKKDWGFYNEGSRWTFGTYLYKAVKQYGLKIRLAWHWNIVAGDPYYALDCREDDFAWALATPEGKLMTSVEFERQIREGLDDYRIMLTLDTLAKKANKQKAQAIIQQKLSSFRLGQYKAETLFPVDEWQKFRRKMAQAIEQLNR